MFLKCAGAHYDEAIDAPFFLSFLDMIFEGDADLIAFTQKLFGLYLTGSTDEQMFIYCYGDGRNGKTTFFNILKWLLGDYFHTFPIDVLLSKKNNSSGDYYKAEFYGMRLIVTSEVPEGRRMNEGEIKDLTGGEKIKARPIYGKPVTFEATHKLALYGNHKLIITGNDLGVWRRVKMIPFTATIPQDKVIPMSEVERRIKAELPGVLNWAIEGYKNYKAEGLNEPEKVIECTNEYRAESDTFQAFIDENMVEDCDGRIKITEILEKYREWCKENRAYVKYESARKIATALRSRGKTVENGTGHALYLCGYKMPLFGEVENIVSGVPF
jgi:putative DNA primase/helicase